MTRLEIPHIKITRLGNFSPFQEALEKLRDTFVQFGQSDGDQRVIVDLFPHGGLPYHIGNLLVAKYVSILTGRHIVGVSVETPLFIRSQWHWNDINALAEAFGVEDIVFLDAPAQDANEFSPAVKTALHESPAEFVRTVEEEAWGRAYHGFEDRVRRRYLLPELKSLNVPRDWLKNEYVQHRKLVENVKSMSLQAGDFFVCGHLEYDPYKFFALNTVRAGGSVIYNWALQPFTLKKFETEEDLLRLAPPAAWEHFDEAYRKLSQNPSAFDGLANLYRASLKRVRPTTIGDKSLGEADSQKQRGVVLMTQAISDAVHSYGPMLFDDFADWIDSSIEFLTQQDLDVCLRDHPMQPLYDQTGYAAVLKKKYGQRYSFQTSPGEDVLDLTPFRMAVTTQGTPGIELPLDNIRTVVTGSARYSGYGFVDEPRTRDEYYDILADQTPLPENELRRRFERAALFGYMELFSFRTTCRLLPRGLKGQPREVLEHLISMISLEGVFSDPLFAQVSKLTLGGETISFNEGSIASFGGALASNKKLGLAPQPAEQSHDWWRTPNKLNGAAFRGDNADRPRPVDRIAAELRAAKTNVDDVGYATAVYRAFFGEEPEQAWLNGAFKCLGRPWGRKRLIHHAFDRYKQIYRSDMSWGELRRAI